MSVKTKFLTVVWGHIYIERFASLSLPSYLAAGNLPALAEATDLEVVIMTASKDINYFEEHETFKKLQTICKVKFIDIDDLITTSVYGVTLTLAYARAVINCGPDMINTHFVFMNSDFVLANNSLRSLSKNIIDGNTIVIAPSCRVTAESMEPVLYSALDESTHTITMSPRDMVSHALKYLHPTTLVKIVNQNLFHSSQTNQLFWWVDNHTLLARYYLIFMLCLKPEKIVTKINSYCDYGFIPEMCPSGDISILGDSDLFFMLELQAHNQERFMLRPGSLEIKKIARSLNRWTTEEHRKMAHYNVVFHSKDIPPDLEKFKQEADIVIDKIQQKLSSPISHAFHYHWVQGIHAWKYYRSEQGLPAAPPEMDTHPKLLLYNMLSAVKQKLLGGVPYITLFHPDYLDYRFLNNTVRSLPANEESHILIISETPEIVKKTIGSQDNIEFIYPNDVFNNKYDPENNNRPYTHIFIYLRQNEFYKFNTLVKLLKSRLHPNGELQFFIQNLFEIENLSLYILDHLDYYISNIFENTKFKSVGGKIKYINWLFFNKMKYNFATYGILSILWIVPMLFPILLYSYSTNLYFRNKIPTKFSTKYCSSMWIQMIYKPDEE